MILSSGQFLEETHLSRKKNNSYFSRNCWEAVIIYSLFQEHKEVGLIQKVFWCLRNEDSPWYWRAHEIYFMMTILVFPGRYACLLLSKYLTNKIEANF